MTEDISKMSFKDAYSELEVISKTLQSDTDDLDSLIDNVKRAANLINFCKTKLTAAEKEIDTIISQVETPKTERNGQSQIVTEEVQKSSDKDLPF